MNWTLTTALALLLASCIHIDPPPPVDPPDAPDACAAFCELQVKLECDDTADSPGPDEIDGTADDVPCVEVCKDIVSEGGYSPDRACLDAAKTCTAAEECVFGPYGALSRPRRPGEPARLHTPLRGPPGLREALST